MIDLDERISTIVSRVLAELGPEATISDSATGSSASLDEAVEKAADAQKKLVALPLSERTRVVEAMRKAALANVEVLSRMAVEETGMGRIDDKIKKNMLVARSTPGTEDLEPTAYSGDHGLTLVERAPYGVIGTITPSTNPTETVINNGIGMVAAANSVVFNPHPTAKRVTAKAIEVLTNAAIDAGGPPNVMVSVSNPSIETAQSLMQHEGIRLLVVTGGPQVVKTAMQSTKKVIAAGPGNPPVVVDETADVPKAARDIIAGASLDNNIVCIAEKVIVVTESAVGTLSRELESAGAYKLSSQQASRLRKRLVLEDRGPGRESVLDREFVGKNAGIILKEIGVDTSEDLRLIFYQASPDDPMAWTEQLMPVIPMVTVSNVDRAIEYAKEVEHGYRHTMVMHSRNIESLSKMAKVIDCSIFVKNGPSYAGLGFGGEGFTSFTIASPTGEGLTSARTFSRVRRCTLVDYFRIV
jgi:acyl-CoA reductase-like NAD-dependent aldehyde dehydrogenase